MTYGVFLRFKIITQFEIFYLQRVKFVWCLFAPWRHG